MATTRQYTYRLAFYAFYDAVCVSAVYAGGTQQEDQWDRCVPDPSLPSQPEFDISGKSKQRERSHGGDGTRTHAHTPCRESFYTWHTLAMAQSPWLRFSLPRSGFLFFARDQDRRGLSWPPVVGNGALVCLSTASSRRGAPPPAPTTFVKTYANRRRRVPYVAIHWFALRPR